MAGETLRFTVLGRGDASDLDRLAAAVDRITDQIRDLDNARANPEIDVDTRRATQQTGKFAKDFQRTLTRAIESIPEVELDADASDAQREIQAVRAELVELSDQRLGVDIDADEAQRRVAELKARLEALGDVDLDVQMRADVGAAVSQLAAVNGEIDRLDGRTAKVKIDVDRSFADTIVQVAALGRALATLTIPAALVAAAPVVAGLGAAAVEASGALALIPAAGTAAAAAVAAVKVGLVGVKEALKVRGDAEAFAAALKELAPAAAEFATQVRALGPAWKEVRLDVQNRLFQETGAALARLSGAYLPSVQSALGGIADAFNQAARESAGFLSDDATVKRLAPAFEQVQQAVSNAAGAMRPLTEAFTILVETGASRLPAMGQAITDVATRFRDWLSEAQQSGQLDQWIDRGIAAIQQLGRIAGDVGAILGSVFDAASQAGVSFLDTVERITQGVRDFLSSAQGQSALVTTFREISAAVDALQPGLVALATGIAQMVSAFAGTGALQAAATALSDLAAAIAPLLPALGELAGNALVMLSSAVSTVSGVIGPLVSLLTGLLGALGPIAPAALAMGAAFLGLRSVGGIFAGLGASLASVGRQMSGAEAQTGRFATALGKLGVSTSAVGKLATAFNGLGVAVPLAGAALVGIMAIYDQLRSKAEENAKAVANGSMTMKQAIDAEVKTIQTQRMAYEGLQGEGYATGVAIGELTGKIDRNAQAAKDEQQAVQTAEQKWREYRATLSPMAQLQADVTRAKGELDDAIASGNEDQAAAAAGRYSGALGRLEDAQKKAEEAAKTHEQRIQELGDTMRSQAGAALSYEQAVLRTAEAQKQANAALKEHGADSTEYKTEVLNLAQAQLAQAEAARAQGEALGDATTGAEAFNREILRMDTSTQAGKDAFAKLVSGMDDAGLAALSAAAAASGLRTEILTLPDGRKVRVVVEADKSELDTAKEAADALARTKWVGTVTLNGDPKPFQGMLLQSVKLADGTVAMMKLNADGTPASIVIQGTKYTIDSTTGTMKIQGDPAPGTVSLNGFKLVVDQTTGTMQILAADGQARATNAALKTSVDTSIGTITINGDPTQANGQTQAAVTFADGSTGTMTIDGDPATARGNITATVQYADGSTGTITVTETGTASVNRAIDNAARDRTATIRVVQIFEPGAPGRPGGTGLAGGGVIGYSGGGLAPARAANGMVVRGYQPGRDTVPAVISRGEAVLVPELVRMLGARRILAANRAASGGREPTTIGQLAGMMDGTIGRRFAGGGMVRAEDGSYVPSNYWSKGGGAGYTLGSSLGSLGLSVRRMAGGGVAGSSRTMPRWAPTSTGGSRDSLAREIHALAEELRERGRKDVNIVNNFAIDNASQAADEVARTQRVAGALGIFGD